MATTTVEITYRPKSCTTLELADDHPQSRMLEPQILESQHDEPPKPKKLLGVRHLQFVLLFFTFVIFSAISNSITVAIISMTEETPPDPSIPKIPTPWLSMASSVPVWSLIIASIGQWYGTMLLLTEIPSYMANIMNYDISSNSLLSSLPYLIQFLLSITASPVADKIVEKQIVSITLTRKIFNSLGSVIPAAALIALAFLQTFNNVLVTLLFIIAVSSTALGWSGFFLNIIDLAPNHAGTLAGIVNTAGAIFSILSPLSVQFFGTDKKDPILWKNVFLLAAGAFLGCNAFYCVFGTAKVQSWNDAATEETFESRRGNNRIYTRKS